MPEASPELLSGILTGVLEDAAFLFTEPIEEPVAWDGPVVAAKLAFESTQGGTLRLLGSEAASVELAANMLGVEPSDPEAGAQGRAAFAEILNMIGGTFITRFFGTQVPSQLGLPVLEPPGIPSPGPRTCAVAVQTEGGARLLLELDLEKR